MRLVKALIRTIKKLWRTPKPTLPVLNGAPHDRVIPRLQFKRADDSNTSCSFVQSIACHATRDINLSLFSFYFHLPDRRRVDFAAAINFRALHVSLSIRFSCKIICATGSQSSNSTSRRCSEQAGRLNPLQ